MGKPSMLRRMGEAGLRGRGTDVAGLLLVVVALISLLALFGDKACLLYTSPSPRD